MSCVHPVAVLNAAFCMTLSSSHTTLSDAKPTQRIETTHPDNVDLKLNSPKPLAVNLV